VSDVILIQTSLRNESNTGVLIEYTAKMLTHMGISNQIIDLREWEIPFCDGRKRVDYGETVQILHKKMRHAKAFVFGFPIYSYTMSGVAKNFIDIFGGAMIDRYFGIVNAAGGQSSYLASKDLMAIMAFDFNATAVQPIVFGYRQHFSENKLNSEYVETKVEAMLRNLLNLSRISVQDKMKIEPS